MQVSANIDINIILNRAISANESDVVSIVKTLNKNPRLLLQRGDVVTPSGMAMNNVTLYEVLLIIGDTGFIKKVEPIYSLLHGGELERVRQYERYKPRIVELSLPALQKLDQAKVGNPPTTGAYFFVQNLTKALGHTAPLLWRHVWLPRELEQRLKSGDIRAFGIGIAGLMIPIFIVLFIIALKSVLDYFI